MGDRYYLEDIKCAYCKYKQLDEIYYSPTSSIDTFDCEKCKETNFITTDFKIKKAEDVTYKDIEEGFLNSTSVSWTEEEVKKICLDRLKELKSAKPTKK